MVWQWLPRWEIWICVSNLKVVPKGNIVPEAEGEGSKGSNVLVLHLGKTPQPTKTNGVLIQMGPIIADLVFAKN